MEDSNVLLSIEEQLRESQAFLQISQMLARSMDLPTILRQIVDASASLIPNVEQSVIHLVDETNSLLRPAAVARPDFDPMQTPLFFRPGEGIAGLVIADGQTINVTDTSQDKRFLLQEKSTLLYKSLLVAPIKLQEKTIGTLSVESTLAGAFSPVYERLITNLGEQAALAIERAQVLQEEQEQRQLAEALREASNIQANESDLDSVLDQILKLVKSVIPYDFACVMFLDKSTVRITHLVGSNTIPKDLIKITEKSFELNTFLPLNSILESTNPVIISDTSTEANWFIDSSILRSWAGAPILAQGKTIALLSIFKNEPGFYDTMHADKLMAFAGQASLTIQNAQLFDSIQQRLGEVNFLYRNSQGLAQSFDTDNIIEQAIKLLQDEYNFYFIRIMILDLEKNLVVYSSDMETEGKKIFKDGLATIHNFGIPGHVAKTNQHFISNDITKVPFFKPNPDMPLTCAELAVPLRSADRLLGVLDIHHKVPSQFKDYDLQIIYTIAEQITLAVEKTLLYDDLQNTYIKEQAARAQLVQSEKLAALGRIVASVAHELNNPLQAIQNALYLINLEDSLNTQAREDLRVALNEADRMAGLIARLRETYRPTSSEEFQRYSINDLVLDVEKLISTHLRRNNISFIFTPGSNIPESLFIVDQIKQVILNISLNAVESMPNGGQLSLNTRYYSEENQIILEISDSGFGIDPEVLPNIFDPFVTTKDRGTGLGLAITYDIVRRHGGHIDLTSEVGFGTTFYIKLPINTQPIENPSIQIY